ncbi:MAG: D-glycerate dehydrogenase [Acidobacteria bacterium]|nr:D-glycerate dehydrogenase [Acidobacteriota bacterium]
MKPKVLITKRLYPEAIQHLRQFTEIEYNNAEEGFTAEELLKRLADKQGVVSQLTDKFTAEVMDKLPNLKVISNVAVGFDNIDIPGATKRRTLVTNTPEVLTETTADFTFALLMATARRVVEGDAFLRSGQYQEWQIDLLCGYDIHHRTLGLIGLGRIGKAVARRARGFEMIVLYHDAVRLPREVERGLGLEFAPLDTLLAESDFISLHVPLLPETHHLIGAPQLAKMKRTAILINTSRGPVVNEEALARALASGRIAGAGLDVYEHEPTVHTGLLDLKNAVLQPHIASASIDTRTRMCVMAADNMVAALNGRRPPNLVNVELWPQA